MRWSWRRRRADGDPSARVVLCKRLDVAARLRRLLHELRVAQGTRARGAPRAAAVLHWDALHRQVRIEGPVVRSPDSESDEYFASRALDSRIAAWASAQSEPLASRDVADSSECARLAARFGIAPGATNGDVPRPPHWGGHRLWIDTIELWTEGANRVHDRAVWTRTLQRADEYHVRGAARGAARDSNP